MIAEFGSPFLVLVLVGYVAVCVVSAVVIFWGEERRQREALLERLTVGFAPVSALEFDPPAGTIGELRATQSGDLCPIGAAAPTTVRPALVEPRPHDRAASA